MFRKSFCKNFPISLSTGSLHSPTTLEQIQPNQSKAKFCAVGAFEASPVNPKSQPRKKKYCNNHQVQPTKLHTKPIKQPKSSMKPPLIHRHDKRNPYLKSIKQPISSTSHHHLAFATDKKRKPYPKFDPPYPTQKSSTHHIHHNPTHQKQFCHNPTPRNSTQQS